MKVAVYTNKDGGLTVQIPANNVYVLLSDETKFVTIDGDVSDLLIDREVKSIESTFIVPAQYRKATSEEIFARDIPKGTDYRVVDSADLPQDRHFRQAWEHSDGAVSHNMDKCRELHKEHLRQKRAPLLAALDLEYMKADESGDAEKKSTISAKKQSLRDITKHPDISKAASPEELKAAALGALNV